jgi:hypothetical protein
MLFVDLVGCWVSLSQTLQIQLSDEHHPSQEDESRATAEAEAKAVRATRVTHSLTHPISAFTFS